MTNKTEMVSAPLYATEEMKRAGMERMAQAQRDGSASLYAYAAVCWEAMIECYQESAAPAEDVRAAREEPVYLYRRKGFDSWATCDRKRFEILSDHQCFEVDTLYRHPQRPVAPQCSEVTGQCSEHLRTQGRPVVLPECPSGYGHGGNWCGPEYNCWLDRRPKVIK